MPTSRRSLVITGMLLMWCSTMSCDTRDSFVAGLTSVNSAATTSATVRSINLIVTRRDAERRERKALKLIEW